MPINVQNYPNFIGHRERKNQQCSVKSPFSEVIILSPLPLKLLECLGPRLCHYSGSWEDGSRLRLGSHVRCSSCSRESRWQCSGSTRQQCWVLHSPQTMFMFNYCAGTAVPKALTLKILFSLLFYYFHP